MELENRVAHSHVPEVKALDSEKRQLTHLISNATKDRDGDVVEPLGWDWKHYAKNPIVLVDHDYSAMSIIGRSVAREKSDQGLYSTTQFAEKGLGAEAWNLVEAKLANAWSVGFVGTKSHFMKDGADDECPVCQAHAGKTQSMFPPRHFVKQSLMEYSLVAIPSNPDAVARAIREGVVSTKNVSKLFRFSPTFQDESEAHMKEVLISELSKEVATAVARGVVDKMVEEMTLRLDGCPKCSQEPKPDRAASDSSNAEVQDKAAAEDKKFTKLLDLGDWERDMRNIAKQNQLADVDKEFE